MKIISDSEAPRLLGAAFLVQAVASAVAGLVILLPLIVPGDIASTMVNFSENTMQVHFGILVEMVTVIGLVLLSALFYTLRRTKTRSLH